jgi:hypothetical protein
MIVVLFLREKVLAQPLNLFDPKSGIEYFQAVTAVAKVYRQGVTTNNFNPSGLPANLQQYWTDMPPEKVGKQYFASPEETSLEQ